MAAAATAAAAGVDHIAVFHVRVARGYSREKERERGEAGRE